MAHSPSWKVYGPDGQYEAACKHLETAASVVSFLGNGATIRRNHGRILWREGSEAQPAAESYDNVLGVCLGRLAETALRAAL